MKTKIQKYKSPTSGYVLRLGFAEITTIKMALEDKLRKHMSNRSHSKIARKEARLTAKAMRGLNQREIYVD
jgi:hypothetical protein